MISSSSTGLNCIKFYIEDYLVGYIHREFLPQLAKYSSVFVINSDCVRLHPQLGSFEQRTAAVENVMQDLRGSLKALKGWQNEHYGVCVEGHSRALMSVERAASRVLGIKRYGVHINGYTFLSEPSMAPKPPAHVVAGVEAVEGHNELKLSNVPPNLRMWIALRSKSKTNWPGFLDLITAGGLPYSMKALDCAKKEAREEAGIPDGLLENLKPCGTITYAFDDDAGVGAGVAYLYDLELPPDFHPVNCDKEVEEFYLLSPHDVAKLIQTESFKQNCGMTVLDFFIRHGYVDPDENPRLEEWLQLMHYKLPYD
ncbi:unnamed protein product [Mesocestoides corti]|uniref:Nudix hydrolase domain-containing protein n=1 Tax=Mesocestoides corti TaxID=53468 RepID=A0A0R3UJ42_MESCO|nr:unnamed protein product [Mesocestoides corti]